MLGEDPELESAVLGRDDGLRRARDREAGVDLSAGDEADATSDAGPAPPAGAEPDLKDAPAAARDT